MAGWLALRYRALVPALTAMATLPKYNDRDIRCDHHYIRECRAMGVHRQTPMNSTAASNSIIVVVITILSATIDGDRDCDIVQPIGLIEGSGHGTYDNLNQATKQTVYTVTVFSLPPLKSSTRSANRTSGPPFRT